MSLIATSKGGGDFKPAPAGSHAARCCWVVDLGTHYSERWKKAEHKVLIGWELPEEIIEEGDRAGEPYFASRRYTVSLHEKAALRHDLESWRGRAFTDAELSGFDLRTIADKPCLITIAHNEKDGKTYSNVTGVTSLPKAMKCADRVNELRIFDLSEPDSKTLEALPEWVQKIIADCDEIRGIQRSTDEPPPPDDRDEVPQDDEVPF